MQPTKFVFEIIATHFESHVVKIKDPARLQIATTFGSAKVALTASRINVTEFKNGREFEFAANPKKLRKTLEENGLTVNVSYNTKSIGTGQIAIPQMQIDRIQEDMSDWMHVDRCNYEKDGAVAGTVELLCRMVIKCDEPAGEAKSCQRNMDKSINRDDIMFIMTESQRCPEHHENCADALPPEEGDERLQLDIERYRSKKAGRGPDLSKEDKPSKTACCELKKVALECEEMVDSLTQNMGHPKPLVSSCRGEDEAGSTCSSTAGEHGQEDCIKPSKACIPSFSYSPARQGDNADFCNPRLIPKPIGSPKPPVKPSRFCPNCLTNMSWLPDSSPCPNCGIKPIPVVEKRHKEKRFTSEQIIEEYLGKPKQTIDETCADICGGPDQQQEKRCTCAECKKCAHCRTRNVLRDILTPEKDDKGPVAKTTASEDFYLKEKEPYFAQVLSDLRNVYGGQDTPFNNPVCGEKVTQNNYQPSGQHSERQKKHKKLHKFERKITPFGYGHKECLKPKGIVSSRHGWAWNLSRESKKHGWQPGFVRKSVQRIMKYFLNNSALDGSKSICKRVEEGQKEFDSQQPTLNLCKKDGVIYVTLRACNDPKLKMHPITFKIIKSNLAVAMSDIKKRLKAKGFSKCSCHQTVMMCTCRNATDKKCLEYAVQHECDKRCIASCVDTLVLTDTSDSEMDFDFDVTPPAAMPKSPCRLRRKTVNNGTQFNKKDLDVVPKYPIKINSFQRAYDCAAGDRYTPTAFGFPGEIVYEDGIFGFGGGGPHGDAARPGGRNTCASKGGFMGRGRGGMFGDKSFPGAKKTPSGPSKPIPVKMLQRYINAVKAAEQAEKDAIQNEIARKKKGIDVMRYLMSKGTIETPWDPNNPKPKNAGPPAGPVVGPDGLTDAQRKRRAMQQMCIPPLDSMPRLGKGIDPCRCYYPCGTQCCYPCGPQCSYPGCYYC